MEKQAEQNWILTPGEDGSATLEVKGDWTKPTFLEPNLDGLKRISVSPTQLGEWNAFLATALYHLLRRCEKEGIEFDYTAMPEGIRKLLKLATATAVQERKPSKPLNFLEKTGYATYGFYEACHTGCWFTGELVQAFLKLCVGKARMRWKDLYSEICKAGPSALCIVALISWLMGVILAFVGSIPLKWFNVELYVASLIGIGMCRMLGAVMTGVVMSGRTGAAYAAELGTMQTNDEIDALSSMGISPMEFLVLPRFLALTLMMPFLGIFSFFSGIIGGLCVGVIYLQLSPLEFWTHLIRTTRLNDLYVGIVTSFVYGILISICGCLRGLRCGHSSEAVGQATTSAMVSSIICMVIATFFITVITVVLKI